VRIVKKDERWIELIRKREQFYLADPRAMEHLSRKQSEPLKQATIDIARAALEPLLKSGNVQAIGFHHDKQQRLRIHDEAWSTRIIDFAKSALLPRDRYPESFPKITGIVVSRDNVIAAFDKIVAAKDEAAEEPILPQGGNASSSAEAACSKWLATLPENPRITKKQAFTKFNRLQSKNGRPIIGPRPFNRAWEQSAHPEWRAPGRRPGS
jgi:hypothetical protein